MLRLVHLLRTPSARPAARDEFWPLAEAASTGDRAATRTLLTALGPELLRVVRRVLGARHPDVEDVAQECALELVGALKRFRHESSVRYFASRVALQTAMNARRKLAAGKRTILDASERDVDERAGGEPNPEARALSRSGLEMVLELCEQLPPVQSEAILLHWALGYTTTEIAAISQSPLETVKSRLRAAKLALTERALADPRARELFEETA
jgi:RNA polymerase sigma-70 factor, ECF subfamily